MQDFALIRRAHEARDDWFIDWLMTCACYNRMTVVRMGLETIDSLIDWWLVRAKTWWQVREWSSRRLSGISFFFFFFFFLGNLENLSLMLTNKIIPPIEEYLKGIISRDTGTVRIPGLTLGIRKLVPTLLWVNGWSPTYK